MGKQLKKSENVKQKSGVQLEKQPAVQAILGDNNGRKESEM